jgi:hypothetical protein
MDAKQFLKAYSTSVTQWDIASIVRMARIQGYRFTADEIETSADELWGNLSEEQLRDVAGGGGNGRESSGVIVVDTASAGVVTSTTETWTPPPGDVSGNSCFFTRR